MTVSIKFTTEIMFNISFVIGTSDRRPLNTCQIQICAKRKTTRIAGSDFPHEVVRSRFLKLDCSHIEFVMECLRNNTTEIRNMKQYLLAVLFNAPTTISNHYTAQVNHDMYAGGW